MIETMQNQTAKRVLSWLLAAYGLFLSFEEILIGPFGSVPKIFGLLITVLVLALYWKNWKNMKAALPLLVWLGYMMLSVLWAGDMACWRGQIQIYITNVVFLCVMEMVPAGTISRKTVGRGLMLGGCLVTAVLLAFPEACEAIFWGRRTLTLLGRYMDPNVSGIILLLGVYSALNEFYESEKNRTAALFLVITVFQLLGVLLGGSRGALLAAVGGVVVMLVIRWKNPRDRKRTLILLACGAAAVAIAVPTVLKDMLHRFSPEFVFGIKDYERKEGRFITWLYAWRLFLQRPIIGYGCGNFVPNMELVFDHTTAHNIIVLAAIEGGILGVLALLPFFLKLAADLIKHREVSVLPMVVSVMIMALTLDSLNFKYFWLVILLARLAIREQTAREAPENA